MELIPAKHILSRTNGSHWFGLSYSMNLYRGCSHGCIYCDSRSECYGIAEFNRVSAKQNCLSLLRDELARLKHPFVVGTGSMSDPYNPLEAAHQLTRGALELLRQNGCGVAIATKSTLILRDLDLLCELHRQMPVMAKMTVTTADDALSRLLEPGAPPSSQRLAALGAMGEKGLFTGILLMPVLPFIEDTEENICAIVRLAAENRVRFIYPAIGVTLRDRQRLYFYQQLDRLMPGVRRQYEATYGDAYECRSPAWRQLYARFASECEAHGILYRMDEITKAFHLRENPQTSLF